MGDPVGRSQQLVHWKVLTKLQLVDFCRSASNSWLIATRVMIRAAMVAFLRRRLVMSRIMTSVPRTVIGTLREVDHVNPVGVQWRSREWIHSHEEGCELPRAAKCCSVRHCF